VVRDLSTRTLGGGVPSATVAIWAGAGVTLLGLSGLSVEGWAPMTLREGLIVVFASACLVVGYMTVVMVMRVGDIGTIAPFRYTALLWAILLGYVVFGAFPDRLTVLGAGIVVATGIYTLLREGSLRRRRR
jgi:drug/metabolite transporter (DMT)-like permease